MKFRPKLVKGVPGVAWVRNENEKKEKKKKKKKKKKLEKILCLVLLLLLQFDWMHLKVFNHMIHLNVKIFFIFCSCLTNTKKEINKVFIKTKSVLIQVKIYNKENVEVSLT